MWELFFLAFASVSKYVNRKKTWGGGGSGLFITETTQLTVRPLPWPEGWSDRGPRQEGRGAERRAGVRGARGGTNDPL